MEELKRIANILKELRGTNKYSKSYVAKYLNIKHQSYSSYETGKTTPTLENFIKLAKLYDVSLDTLIARTPYSDL